MDWLNLHIGTIDSPEATLCDPVRRATWVWLLRFCIGQENGGRIEKCGAWGDTTWQQMARVRLREVRLESTLWHWDGDALVVHFYPVEKESEVQAKRELARTNGRTGGRPRKTNVGCGSETDEKPTSVISPKAEGNGMERNGIGMEYTPAAAAAVVAPAAAPGLFDEVEPQPAAAPKMIKSWMDWRLTIGRHRVYLDREGNAEAHWAELFNRAGWDEFTKAWEYCAGKTAGKVFLSNMLEVIS
jgi:hypothetical protein